jgi:hypothetical protein
MKEGDTKYSIVKSKCKKQVKSQQSKLNLR